MKQFIFSCFVLFTVNLFGQKIYDQTKLVKSFTFNFETSKAILIGDDAFLLKQDLTSLGDLNDLNRYEYLLSGHTDSDGDKKANKRLSLQRALVIEKLLIANGVKKSSIETTYYGSDKPIGDNTTEEGKKSNRRTELLIYSKSRIIIEKIVSSNAVISGILNSTKTGIVKGVKIVFTNGSTAKSINSDQNGKYAITLPSNAKYGVSASLEKHFGYNNEIELNQNNKVLDITFVPLEENQTVSLSSITFYNNKAVLLDKSKPVLAKILDQLKKESNICFEVQGHVNAPMLDPNSKDVYTSDLSLARALSIYDYFSKNGISPERMYAVGYGHTKMIYPKAVTTEEHLANMRVDLKTVNCSEVKSAVAREDKATFDRLRSSVYFK